MFEEIITYLKDPTNQVAVNVITFVAGGVSGFLVSRFTMSKAERKTYEQSIYENSINHTRELETRYSIFTGALSKYIAEKGNTSLDSFLSIANAGDLYFSELKIICDAILNNKIDSGTRDRTFVPKVVEAIEKNIPLYYKTLQDISNKVGGSYKGAFDRENYQSIIQVSEKYGRLVPNRPLPIPLPNP
jgi:hypothetical protein